MPVRGVVGDEVENSLEAATVRFADQTVEIGKRAEQRIDAAIIRNVVAEIGHRRRIDRRNPDRVDTKPDEVVQPLNDAVQVTNAVAIRILKRPGIDLIDDAALP